MVGERLQTAVALDDGEWDIAPIVLRTPNGFLDTYGHQIDAGFLLIEGHKRRRYLNALVERGRELIDQRVFVIDSPLAT